MTLIVCVFILVLHPDKCKTQCILGSGIEMLLFLLQFQSICGLCSTVGWLCTQPSTQAFIHKQPLYNPLPRFSYTNNTCAIPVLCSLYSTFIFVHEQPLQWKELRAPHRSITIPALRIHGRAHKLTKIQTHTGCV